MSTLGERFAKLQAKPSFEVRRQAVVAKAGANQKGKRNNQIQAARSFTKTNQQQQQKGGKPSGNKSGGRPVSAGSKGKLAGKGKVNAKGKGKGKGEKKEKAAPADAASLDMDMDAYWHKAGKGPDPKLSALDRQMEEYNKGRSGGAASAESTTA